MSEGPFDLGLSWRDEVTSARRLRSDSEAASRQPDRLARFRADARRELGAAGAPALAAKTEQLRERWVRDQLVDAGRARAASVGWPDAYAFTKALGEQALDRLPRCRAGEHRPAVDHRVGVGGAAPGLDPRLPHGRAGDPVLRPRPAPRVSRRSRRHRRRHPRRPRRRRDHHRRRSRPRRRAADLPGRLRRHQPAEVPHARRQRQRVVHRAPDLRLRRPADRRPGVAVPWTRPGAGPAQPGQDGDQPGRAAAPRPAAARQAGRAVGQAGEQAPGGRAGARVRRAVRPVHRVRGDLPGRQPAGDVGRPRRRRPARRSTSTRAASTGSATSARSTCRRSSSTPGSRPARGGRRPTEPGVCAGRCCHRTATSPPSTWRTR